MESNFCRVHATLQPALSVPLSVRQSVGQTLFFLLLLVILSHFRPFLVILSHSKLSSIGQFSRKVIYHHLRIYMSNHLRKKKIQLPCNSVYM